MSTPPARNPVAPIVERRQLLMLAASTALLSACAVTPKPPTPPLNWPASWEFAPATPGWVSAADARAWQQGQWWTLWGDTDLNDLVQRVNLSSHTVAQAVAQVAQAEAVLAQQRAGLWPTLGLQASQQRSGNNASNGTATATGSGSINLNASWAPDLWGRLREGVNAQAAQVQAAQADLAAARLSVQSAVVNAYLALREADAEIALLDDIINGYARSSVIASNRYNAGVAARTDLLQADSTLANAMASRVALRRSRTMYEHAIALLLGVPTSQFGLEPVTSANAKLPSIPTDVPAALLLRRPDVAKAERAVAAANAQIGVARAAYFPNLSLTASTGLGAGSLASMLSASNVLWSLGVGLAETLFDGGARSAQVAQTLAARDASIAAYRQTAVKAMVEVEDQLTAIATLAQQTEQVRIAADAATRVEQQMMNRYQAGLSAYTEVVTAQSSALNARRSLLQLQLQRQQATVAVIVALGGGWQSPWGSAEAPPTLKRENLS